MPHAAFVSQRAKPGVTVASTRRLSRRLRQKYDDERRAQGARVWEAPSIFSFHAWLTRLWQDLAALEPERTPVLLSTIQEDALWQRVIGESEISNELASELLDVRATAAMARRAWDLLHDWELPFHDAAFAETDDSQEFLRWARAFQKELQAAGWITHSELAKALSERFAQKKAEPVSYAGFEELTPAQRRLFESCGATAVRHAAPSAKARVTRIAARDTAAELERAAAWARGKIEEAGGPVTIAVMIPGLAAQAALVERVFDNVLHPSLGFIDTDARRAFHISAGVRCDETPWIATALLVLGLKPGLTRGLTAAEAGRLLRSPALALDRVRGASLDAHLRRRRVETVTFDSVREVFPRLHQQARQIFENAATSQRPSAWSSIFSRLVASVDWSEREASPREHRAMEQWKDLLSELASLDRVLPRISYEQALTRLRSIARESLFSDGDQDDEDNAPIQIMDLREGIAAKMNFAAVWIAGLHEGAWPQPVRPNPFLPLALQRAAGVPGASAEAALAEARRDIKRLTASAPEVVCSYPSFAGEEELRPSPLIKTFEDAADSIVTPGTLLRGLFSSPMKMEDQPTAAAVPVERSGFSGGASVLQDQAACPFRAFAIHRLGARELEAEELGVSPRERGNAVHKALEHLWDELRTLERLKSLAADELADLIQTVAEKALKSNDAMERFRSLELRRLVGLLHEWVTEEKRRRNFTVAEKEQDRVAEIGGITLNIRPDRIDRYDDDGGLAIVDYKTSKDLKVESWDGERPDAPQLPFYAIDRGEEVAEVMFAKLVPGDTSMLNRYGAALRQSLPDWKRTLEKLAAEFAAGHAAVDPNHGGKACEFCRLPSFCRVGELGLLAIDEIGGDGSEETE